MNVNNWYFLPHYKPEKMEKIVKIMCFAMIMSVFAISYTSVKAQQSTIGSETRDPNIIAIDPKLSQQEKDLLSSSATANPAKPTTPYIDAKAEFDQADVVSAPAKPSTTATDPKLELEAEKVVQSVAIPKIEYTRPDENSNSVDPNTGQPVEKPSGNVVNFREIKGEQTQQFPAENDNVQNFRSVKGPNTQPAGEQPVR
jgi:hypothetical protein